MRIILQGSGRLAIDILGSNCKAILQNASKAEHVAGPALDLHSFPSLEEALFAGVTFLLQRHYARTGATPSHNVVAAAYQVFEVLLERGHLPQFDRADTNFLAKLLAILEQITDESGKPFFTGLIDFVRSLILGDDDNEQSGGNGAPGNGAPGNGESSSQGEGEPPAKKSGGNNGTPTNGSSR